MQATLHVEIEVWLLAGSHLTTVPSTVQMLTFRSFIVGNNIFEIFKFLRYNHLLIAAWYVAV